MTRWQKICGWWTPALIVVLMASSCGATPPGSESAISVSQQSAPGIEIVTTTVAGQSIIFARQKPVVGEQASMAALLIGELALVDGCLRVNSTYSDTSYVPVWPAGFTVSTENDAVVINVDGQVVARVGDELSIGGGELPRNFPPLVEATDSAQLLASCHGLYWMASDEVRVNQRDPNDTITTHSIDVNGRSFFLLLQTPVIKHWAADDELLRGQLLWDDACLYVRSEDDDVLYVPLWPPDYVVSLENEGVEIMDGSRNVIARVGAVVSLPGGVLSEAADPEAYQRLRVPISCRGTYWLVAD